MDVREIKAEELVRLYGRYYDRRTFVDSVAKEYCVSFPDYETLHRYWDLIDSAWDLADAGEI